jgi:predicted RNA binding protein YcfA (HicA-like mRNA interferase family)
MSKIQKILLKILSGNIDKNVSFDDLLKILEHLGFSLRIKGSHHILFKDGIEDIINIQPNGKLAKPYQVKQVRNIILQYRLATLIENE